jgi:hypothetical protein
MGIFRVALRENVRYLGEGGDPISIIKSARLRWYDPDGRRWSLYWGQQIRSGGDLVVNPNTVGVQITRQVDQFGTPIDEWHTVTLEDDGPDRFGTCTAFLWRDGEKGRDASEFFGAFDIRFEHYSIAE